MNNAADKRLPRVLIADDQADILEALRLLLKRHYDLLLARSPAEVLEQAQREPLDAILMDLNYARDTTSGAEGLALIPALLALDSAASIVVMTAWGSVEGAVEAMRLGAHDYVQKPWDNARLVATLKTQVELSRATRGRLRLEAESERQREQHLPLLVAESAPMRAVRELLDRFAASDANLLITGEHGTGKEVMARWVHAKSQRRQRAFVTVDAGAFADGVFESELFGHVKGAFTDAQSDRTGCFELADQGTLFLDEIGNMPPAQQAKLLRVLQSGEFKRVGSSRVTRVDVRVVAATNAELGTTGFRQDLLYRINTLHIHLPPLRERRADILPLTQNALLRLGPKYGKPGLGTSSAAQGRLELHAWPGNVRELEHTLERAAILTQSSQIQPHDLGLGEPPLRPGTFDNARFEAMTLAELEVWAIRTAMHNTCDQVEKAAQVLGLSRSALYRRLQQLENASEGDAEDANKVEP
jgi:DNA-binding NtrC family response regulator